jgi:hypothetical protein
MDLLKRVLRLPVSVLDLVFQIIWIIRHLKSFRAAIEKFKFNPDYPNSNLRTPHGVLMTLDTGGQTLEALLELTQTKTPKPLPLDSLKERVKGTKVEKRELLLRKSFDSYGSDKGSWHGYSYLYSVLLSHIEERSQQIHILEIGMGTNNQDTPSNMGPNGRPGASLRAFRDSSKNVACFGLDIDERVLFSEDRIDTAKVDQLDRKTWRLIPKKLLENKFDLIIDDGLHSPIANINSLIEALGHLKEHGVFVIEDIPAWSLEVWEIIMSLGVYGYGIRIVEFPNAYCAVIAKVGYMPDSLN